MIYFRQVVGFKRAVAHSQLDQFHLHLFYFHPLEIKPSDATKANKGLMNTPGYRIGKINFHQS